MDLSKQIELDFQREERIGMPEIIYGEFKSREQLVHIYNSLDQRQKNILITRVSSDKVVSLSGEYSEQGKIFFKKNTEIKKKKGKVGIVSAGTSDAGLVIEAEKTLEFCGVDTTLIQDCGVSGLHRLLNKKEQINQCDILIVIAGFEGALPTVIAGLFPQPIIAVPSSIGYGVSQGGEAALSSMLSSCGQGITVVNIDGACVAAMAGIRMLSLLK